MKVEHLFLKLRTATPVHVGCGEVYEPISFYIDDQGLVLFDSGRLIEMLEAKELGRLSAICKKGTLASIIELMRFVRDMAKRVGVDGESIPACAGLKEHYEKTLSIGSQDHTRLKNEINEFKIMRSAHDPMTGRLYLPGSAIKGAIRTAVLNLRRSSARGEYKGKYAATRLQKDILSYSDSNFYSDPFRLIKVSDFLPVGEVKRRIVYAVDRKKGSSGNARAPYQIMEVIEAGVEFAGMVSIYAPQDGKQTISVPISKNELLEALNSFYAKEKEREGRELAAMKAKPISMKSGLPIRIGRHSGAECVTVEGYREIKINLGKGRESKTLDHATTIWMASEVKNPKDNSLLRPFGWSTLSEVSREEWEKIFQKQDVLRAAIYREAEGALRRKARLREEEARKREAEARALEEKRKREADPAYKQKVWLERFENSLPSPAQFPGEASKIIEKIKGAESKELKKKAIALLEKRFKDHIKKARKREKAWVAEFDKIVAEVQ